MKKPLLAILLPTIIVVLISPFIDIWFSSLFYSAENGGFYLKDVMLFKFLRKGFPEIMGAFAGIVILIGIVNHLRKKAFLGITIKESLFLSSSLIIAPGLIVNSILKNFSGRARPSQIDFFGGEKIFSPAFVFTDECQKNCSFASGHASFAFWLTALAMIAPLKYRSKLMILFLLVGVLVSFTRIVQGGHFLSDVAFGGALSIITNLWLYRIIYKENWTSRT